MNRQQEVENLYKALEVRFIKWAETHPDIRVAMVVGSRARTDHPADEWADLDIMIFTNNPEQFLTNAAWLDYIGVPIITFIEPTPSGETWERRVLFDGGIDVDFAVEPYDNLLQVLKSGVTPQMVAAAVDTLGRGILLLVLPGLYLRVMKEEQAMLDQFGAQYQTYREQTGRFLPKVRQK